MKDPLATPDVIVLGGGGILGEAWMRAVLAGVEEAGGFDAGAAGLYLGTSAGSIVAASLVGGERPDERLGELPARSGESPAADRPGALRQWLAAAGGVGTTAAAPLAALGLRTTARGGAVLRRALLARVPDGRRSLAGLAQAVAKTGLRFDGRLLISAVDLESGRRVMFGAPDAPTVSVAAAVQASCSIPGYFAPVRANGRRYVDGGAWSPTNMDAAEVGRHDRVLCLNPTGSLRGRRGDPAGALGQVSRAIAGTEALALRRRGARVKTVNPDTEAAAAMGANLMDPRGRTAVIAAGLAQGRRLARAA